MSNSSHLTDDLPSFRPLFVTIRFLQVFLDLERAQDSAMRHMPLVLPTHLLEQTHLLQFLGHFVSFHLSSVVHKLESAGHNTDGKMSERTPQEKYQHHHCTRNVPKVQEENCRCIVRVLLWEQIGEREPDERRQNCHHNQGAEGSDENLKRKRE